MSYKSANHHTMSYYIATDEYGNACHDQNTQVVNGGVTGTAFDSPATIRPLTWPCTLYQVTSAKGPDRTDTGQATANDWKIERLLPSWQVLGPQGEHVAKLFDRLMVEDVELNTPHPEEYAQARRVILSSCRTYMHAALLEHNLIAGSKKYALAALLVRDLLPIKIYDTLTRDVRDSLGPIHPRDHDNTREPTMTPTITDQHHHTVIARAAILLESEQFRNICTATAKLLKAIDTAVCAHRAATEDDDR